MNQWGYFCSECGIFIAELFFVYTYCIKIRKITPAKSQPICTEMKLIFKQFDLDNDGMISFNDLKSVMLTLGESISEAEIGEMISEV